MSGDGAVGGDGVDVGADTCAGVAVRACVCDCVCVAVGVGARTGDDVGDAGAAGDVGDGAGVRLGDSGGVKVDIPVGAGIGVGTGAGAGADNPAGISACVGDAVCVGVQAASSGFAVAMLLDATVCVPSGTPAPRPAEVVLI
ncbi:MAG: hypothetical protein GXX08_06420 [Firmicutes bacterium]|jgi:hypothetical protein|nr:hypothetical protein [Bacillota bacterium]